MKVTPANKQVELMVVGTMATFIRERISFLTDSRSGSVVGILPRLSFIPDNFSEMESDYIWKEA